jgi:hypothetical protein
MKLIIIKKKLDFCFVLFFARIKLWPIGQSIKNYKLALFDAKKYILYRSHVVHVNKEKRCN